MQIYNLIPILQIAQVLLGDAIISSRTDPHNDSKMEKTKYGKIKNNKTMLKILPFIGILYLNKAVFYESFGGSNLKIFYLAICFSVFYFVVRYS